MKFKRILSLCILLCLTACQAPAEPELVSSTEAVELVTAATTAPTEPETAPPTEPETEPPTEPETEPPIQSPIQAPDEPDTTAFTAPEPEIFDSVDHTIHGYMGMTAMEREFTLAVERREIDLLGMLMDDPRYLDICGGFAYRGGTMYVFSLDDTAVWALVPNPTTATGNPLSLTDPISLTGENLRVNLIPTNISLRDLTALYNQIEADKAKYDVAATLFMPRYNQIAVVANDPYTVDPDLQRLADESRCIEILSETERTVPEDASSVLLSTLTNLHPDVYTDLHPSRRAGETKLRVTDIDRIMKIIGEDSELRLAWLIFNNEFEPRIIEVEYSLNARNAAEKAVLNTLNPLLEGALFTSWYQDEDATLEVTALGMSDPTLQTAARNAAMAAVREATGQSGENIKFEFRDETIELMPAT